MNMLETYWGNGGRHMIYDADDERVGVILDASMSRWWIRDFEGKVLREYQGCCDQAIWTWEQDWVYGEGQLIGGERVKFQTLDDDATPVEFGGLRHYHLDHLGSVRMATDDEGRSVSEHDYYAFGVTPTKAYQEQLNWSDPHIDAARFTGHQREFLGLINTENTDYLDYMHARYYDPNLGRFLSVDPGDDVDISAPQSWNRYAYVRNTPSNATDPSGMATQTYEASAWVFSQPIIYSSIGWFLSGMSPAHQLDQVRQYIRQTEEYLSQKNREVDLAMATWARLAGGNCDTDDDCAQLTWSMVGIDNMMSAGGAPARVLPEVAAVMKNPRLLAALNPAELRLFMFRLQQNGWRMGTLGRGAHKGMGMVLRETDEAGRLTGRMIQFHPGGGHHGPAAYWKVSSAVSGTIRASHGASGGW